MPERRNVDARGACRRWHLPLLRSRQSDSAQQIGKAGIAPEPVERGVDAEKLQLQVARGERLFQRFERLLALAQRDIENGQLARRDVGLTRFKSFQDRLRLLAVA